MRVACRSPEKMAADTGRIWELRRRGYTVHDALKIVGVTSISSIYPLPRTEVEIRRDLAQQLETIVRRFHAMVAADKERFP